MKPTVTTLSVKKRLTIPPEIKALSDDVLTARMVVADVRYQGQRLLQSSSYHAQITQAECLGPMFEEVAEQFYQSAKRDFEILKTEYLNRKRLEDAIH